MKLRAPPKLEFSPLKGAFYPIIACPGCILHRNATSQPFFNLVWWKSVHRPNTTCWVKNTHYRRSDAIFQDSCRCIVGKALEAASLPFMIWSWWTSVHRPITTYWALKTHQLWSDAIFQDGRRIAKNRKQAEEWAKQPYLTNLCTQTYIHLLS